MRNSLCPFCSPPPEQVFFRGEWVYGMWDCKPSSPGQVLLIPLRHVESWFEASVEEQSELVRALHIAKAAIEMRYAPMGYNIGINVGATAGQTMSHLHVDFIPRYPGYVHDPRGGVRHVIPANGNYLTPLSPDSADSLGDLVRGGREDPLLERLIHHFDQALAIDIAAAFTLESGVRLIEDYLRDVLDRGGRVRILTGDYLGVTEPVALRRLLDLQGDVHARVFEAGATSFHPKAYIIRTGSGHGVAYVGSSNLSDSAMRTGIEWNYRVVTTQDTSGFASVASAFEQLWNHPKAHQLDSSWIREYEARRATPLPRTVGLETEPVGPPPEPHEVQVEALDALVRTREAGNTAALVVLATGLGKTWLSAFDTENGEYKRVLFIAHREEILAQALRTFRTIRPNANFGLYTGFEKTPEADVLFGSIQTLGRSAHLSRFDPSEFDYIIVDEFHHAAAQTYRRVLSYFQPRFLLGLTATPERTDGGDLLSLCGDNLVYRCDVADGIRRGLLSPFAYYGVPDEVDYTNIPWRSTRFDEEALTQAVATRTRAQNALEQYRRYGQERTIAFCVSQRHADFMAAFFRENDLRAVAVHSGPSSAPRTHSLKQLEVGELDIMCAVDMFNEGVDLPQVDTILMLRPTESRIVWLQQFGRGLRFRPGKTLRVVDYIGNHRIFLTKTRALLELGNADREIAYALEQLESGARELPPGCSVTYELEAKEIIRSLLRLGGQATEQLRNYYEEFRETHGVRPLALEIFEDGFNPRSLRVEYGSWLGFVEAMEDLTSGQIAVRERMGVFLDQLEVTSMTKSYKMLVLQAMIGDDALPGTISIEKLTQRFSDLARRYTAIREEIGEVLEEPATLQKLIEANPIAAWIGGAGTGGVPYFRYAGGQFNTIFEVPQELKDVAQDLVGELVDWRLTEYLHRVAPKRGSDRFTCRVSHAGGRPIIFLPDRGRTSGIPEGWVELIVDDEPYQGKFVQVALNVVSRPGTEQNILPDILRRWFGPAAGQPGRTDTVVFERNGRVYEMKPAGPAAEEVTGPVRWRRYNRDAAVDALGIKLSGWDRQAGIVQRPDTLVFFVTLDKSTMAEQHKYRDRFVSATEFEWQSQNRNTQSSALGQQMLNQRTNGTAVHLFVRKQAKIGGRTQGFIYAGQLQYLRWEGEKPITVWWGLEEPVPQKLWAELEVP